MQNEINRETLKSKELTPEILLNCTDFQKNWAKPTNELMEFVAHHSVSIFEYSIHLKSSTPFIINNASMVFQSCDKQFLSVLFSQDDFIFYIGNFISKVSSYESQTQSLFFDQLSSMITGSSYSFFKYIDFDYFIHSLLKFVYIDPVFLFLSNLIPNTFARFYFKFEKIELPKLLIDEFFKFTFNGSQSSLLFIFCLEDSAFAKESGKCIIANSFIIQIYSTLIKNHNLKCAELLRILFSKSIVLIGDENWKKIHAFFIEKYDSICNELINSNLFDRYENSISILFLMISDNEKLATKKTQEVLEKEIELFFEYPTNSFLHLFVVSALELFIHNSGKIQRLLRKTCLVPIIIQRYQMKDEINVSYSGHLRSISFLIDKYVDRNLYSLWDSVVMKENIKTQNLIDKPLDDLFMMDDLTTVPYEKKMDEKLLNKQIGKLVLGFSLFFFLTLVLSAILS